MAGLMVSILRQHGMSNDARGTSNVSSDGRTRRPRPRRRQRWEGDLAIANVLGTIVTAFFSRLQREGGGHDEKIVFSDGFVPNRV